jgi:SNF2 family DNA or RNA helicase
LSRGAILADEVGLGKTIEAGIVLALNQAYSEREKFEERRKPPAFSGVC